MDLAVADAGQFANESQPGQLLIFLGHGDGTFQNPGSYQAGLNPGGVAAGDLDGDGRADLVVTTGGPSFANLLDLFYGQANGTISPGPQLDTDFGPGSPVIADFNGDGMRDVVLTHCCGETQPGFLVGNGDGTLQPEVYFSGGADPFKLVPADVDKDGKLDLAVLHSGAGSAGGFSVLRNISAGPAPFVSVSAASFSGDLGVAPGSIVSAFGENLATGTESGSSINLADTLAGTTVTVRDADGVERTAGLFAVTPKQVNFLIPPDTKPGRAIVTINGASSKSADVAVNRIAPAVFQLNGDGLAAAQLVRVHDGVQTPEDVYLVSNGQVVPRPIPVPDPPDQLVLVLYGTGIRNRAQLSDVNVNIGGITHGAVAYAGPHSLYSGLDQVNVTLFKILQGKGLVDVVLNVEGIAAKPVKLEFQ